MKKKLKRKYKSLLEIAYCIMIKKFGNVNNNILELLINNIIEYRNIYKKNSSELLKLLWLYDIYDDILLQMEEKFHKEISNKSKNKSIVYKNNINNEELKSNNCIFQKVKKYNIRKENKDINNIEQNDLNLNIIKNKKALLKISKEMKQKVENELKKINDYQKNSIFIEKQKEEILLTKEFITKQKLKKIFEKRSLFSGIPKNQKQRPYSSSNEKRDGFILEEGDGEMPYPYEHLINKRKNAKMKLSTLLIYNKYKFIVNYYEEETREKKGIEALNQKYKNQIKELFNKLIDNHETISKSSIIKLLRYNDITNKDFSLDELSLCIKNSFPDKNLVCFNENEFKRLLITIAYYIMNKKNYMYTLFESYELFLKIILKNKNIQDKESWKNIKYAKIKQYLKNNLDINSGKINVLLPPGFKISQKTNVNLVKKFPKNLNKIFKESTIICYSILDDIILKTFNCNHGILEKYVKIEKIHDIETDSSNIKPWSQDLMIAYSSLPRQYNIIGIEVASLLEEGLRKISIGKKIELKINKNKLNTSLKKEKELKMKKFQEKKEKSVNQKELKEKTIKIHENGKIKKEIIENKEKNKSYKKENNKENELPKLILGMNNIKSKNFCNISEMKIKRNEKNKSKNVAKNKSKNKERNNKMTNNIKIIYDKNIKSKIFFTEQNKKIKEELEQIIKNRKLKELKKRNLSENVLIPKINSNYFNENKEYIELDKKLINNIKQIIENNSKIKYYLNKYDIHLKFIFDIYHKIGLNSISSVNFLIDNSLSYNEYKEFLINFGLLNVFISKEQMNFIYKRLSRQNNKDKYDKNILKIDKDIDTIKYKQKAYITYDDFKISLLLIIIFSNMESDNIQIEKNDYEILNEKMVELLFDYLELVIPFYRRDIEDMVNKRRNMNSKELKDWKMKKKNDILNIFYNLYLNENDYPILLKKIKCKYDILPNFSEAKMTKKYLGDKENKKKKKEIIHFLNKSHLKKLKIKKKKSKNNLINLKYSKTFEEKSKSENKTSKKISKKELKMKNEINNKKTNTDISDGEMVSIDFSLSYTNSTLRDKENGSIETNIYTETNMINKSEFINSHK